MEEDGILVATRTKSSGHSDLLDVDEMLTLNMEHLPLTLHVECLQCFGISIVNILAVYSSTDLMRVWQTEVFIRLDRCLIPDVRQ